MWEAYPPQELPDFTCDKSFVHVACVIRGRTFCTRTRCFATLNVCFPKRAVHAVRTHVKVAPLTLVMKIFVCPDVADGKWLVKQGWQQLIGDKSRNGIVDVLIIPHTSSSNSDAHRGWQVYTISRLWNASVWLCCITWSRPGREGVPHGDVLGVHDHVRCEETCPIGIVRTFVGVPQECGVA